MPKNPAPVVGPSDLCACGNTKLTDAAFCNQCWTLRQVVTTHLPKLLANPNTAPATRELLERALQTKAEIEPVPATTTGPA